MAKHSFEGYDTVRLARDFSGGFALLVTFGDFDGRRVGTKRFEFKTARGMVTAESAIFRKNPKCKYNSDIWDGRNLFETRERIKVYNRTYGSICATLPY